MKKEDLMFHPTKCVLTAEDTENDISLREKLRHFFNRYEYIDEKRPVAYFILDDSIPDDKKAAVRSKVCSLAGILVDSGEVTRAPMACTFLTDASFLFP